MNINELLAIYCIGFEKNLPRRTYQYQKNIMANAYYLDAETRAKLTDEGFLFDDTGKNISYLNYTFGDLTASYWVWKNAQEEFVGTCQYKRFWADEEIANLSLRDNIIYINPGHTLSPLSTIEQYIVSHGRYGIDILADLCSDPNYVFKQETFNRLNQCEHIIWCNMFFAQNKIYSRVCDVLFEILFDVFKVSIEEIGSFDSSQRRLVGYVSERVLTALLLDAKHYFGDVELVPVNCIYL